MSGKYKLVKLVFSICIILCLIATGCNILKSNDQKEEESTKRKNPPKALTQMVNETDGIIRDLEDVKEKRARQLREKKSPSKERIPEDQQKQQEKTEDQTQLMQGQEQESQDKQQESQKSEQETQVQQQGQQEQQEQQKQQPDEQAPEPIPEPDWNKLESLAESLNEQWNNYEPSAKSDGAMDETIKAFERQLITLTEQIMARNEDNTLTAAVSLYSYFPDFLKLYAHDQPPEIKQLIGLTRKIILLGQQDKWEETKPFLDQMKKAWQEAKTKMKKNDAMLNKKIEAAINDFQLVVSEKKINITRIKGNILIKNLDQVE